MWKNSLKSVESDNNKILYETILDLLQRNTTYFLNKSRIYNLKTWQVFSKSHGLASQKTFLLLTL
jgi:hypothetical protein